MLNGFQNVLRLKQFQVFNNFTAVSRVLFFYHGIGLWSSFLPENIFFPLTHAMIKSIKCRCWWISFFLFTRRSRLNFTRKVRSTDGVWGNSRRKNRVKRWGSSRFKHFASPLMHVVPTEAIAQRFYRYSITFLELKSPSTRWVTDGVSQLNTVILISCDFENFVEKKIVNSLKTDVLTFHFINPISILLSTRHQSLRSKEAKERKAFVLLTSSLSQREGDGYKESCSFIKILSLNDIIGYPLSWEEGGRSCVETSFPTGLVASRLKRRSLLYDGFTKLQDKVQQNPPAKSRKNGGKERNVLL